MLLTLLNGVHGYSWAKTNSAHATSLRNWDEVISDWQGLLDAHRLFFDTFVWPISINNTQTPSIYVRSKSPFRLRIFRLGWYAGAGAELKYDSVTDLAARNSDNKCGTQSINPTIAAGEHDYGLVECDWNSPLQPSITDLVSGMYLVIITADIDGVQRDNVAMFFVRDDSSVQRLVIVNPTDAQAYAVWSDTPDSNYETGFVPLSFYGQSSTNKTWPRATKVSYNRPMGVESVFDFLKTDYPLIRFLERNGMSYTVATDYDLHTHSDLLMRRHSVIISGHGEYWSYQTRSRLDSFVRWGGNIVAMSSNTGYWQIRYEQSPAGLPGPVVVGYKETALHTNPPNADPDCGSLIFPAGSSSCGDPLYQDGDPTNDYLVTTQFRNPPVNRPEQLLFGVQYQLDPGSNGFELPVTLFTNDIASMQSIGPGISPAGNQDFGVFWNDPDPVKSIWLGNIGWEADIIHPQILLQISPAACLRLLGMTRWPWNGAVLANNQAHIVLYRPGVSSGYVFSGLSMMWSWGIDDWPALHGFGYAPISRVDAKLHMLTLNMLQAVESGAFGNDCPTPYRMTYYFAHTGTGTNGVSLILKESDAPGRWSLVPVQQDSRGVFIDPDPSATANLSGWATASDAYNLFVADVNGDGNADLVAKEKVTPGNWYVALNNGSSFQTQPLPWLEGWAVMSDAYGLFVADVNGDGMADLIAKEKNSLGNWYVALSSGSSFQAQPSFWLAGWASTSDAYDLFIADINGDKKADLVVREMKGPGNWFVALSNGMSFQAQVSSWLEGWAEANNAYVLSVTDVNGDGKADLVAKEINSPGNWYAALSTGSGFLPQSAPFLQRGEDFFLPLNRMYLPIIWR